MLRLSCSVALSSWLLAAGPLRADCQRPMRDLGTLQGLGSSVATAINDSGQVVGWSYASGDLHAFLWSAADGMKDLGTLRGLGSSLAFGINNSGQVVGYSYAGDLHAFIWDAANGMKDLGTLSGIGSSLAYAINDAGQVAGFSYKGGTNHAFVWTAGGGMQDLGVGVATGINNLGQVTGSSNSRAVLWDGKGGKRDLGWQPGFDSAIFGGIVQFPLMAINDLGQVAGAGYAGGWNHAFLWSAQSGVRDLGTLKGLGWSYGFGLNNAGEVTGYSYAGDNHAFRWSPEGGMTDLGTLSGLGFSYGMAVNGAGYVAGASYAAGEAHAFLWKPVEPPLSVGISVKPGSNSPVKINLSANGTVPVAVLGSATFDAGRVDPGSAEFAGARVARKPNGEPMAAAEDVDGDGIADLVLHFPIGEVKLPGGTSIAHLCGLTTDSTGIEGSAAVQPAGR